MFDGQLTTIREDSKSLLILVIWEIWRERNNRVFRRISRSMQQILSNIQDEAGTWAYAGNKSLQLLLAARTQDNVFGQQVTRSTVAAIPSM